MTKEPPVTLESLAFRRGGARLIHCARGQWAALRRGTRRFLTAQTLDQLAAAIEGPGWDWPPWGNVPPHKPPARAGRGYATPPLYGVSPRVIPRRGPGHPPLVPRCCTRGQSGHRCRRPLIGTVRPRIHLHGGCGNDGRPWCMRTVTG